MSGQDGIAEQIDARQALIASNERWLARCPAADPDLRARVEADNIELAAFCDQARAVTR